MEAMDTVMEVRKKRTMKTRHRAFLVSGLCFLCLAGSGCRPGGQEMTTELAEQIAADAAGLKLADLSDISCTQEEDKLYNVIFSTEKGTYSVGVSEDGTVQTYNFQKAGEVTSENPEETQTPEEPAEGSSSEGTEEPESGPSESSESPDSSSSQEEKKDDDTSQADSEGLPEGSLSKSELIRRVAEHIQQKEVREEDYNFEVRSESQVDVKTTGPDGRNYTVTINPQTGQITYTQYSY